MTRNAIYFDELFLARLAGAALLGHGTREQRLASFQPGYSAGAGGCVDALR